MKKNNVTLLLIMALVSTSLLIQSCSKAFDNKNYPTVRVSGKILYNGQPVGLMGTSSDANGQNPLQYRQNGPGEFTVANIKMFARPDGSYTILSYPGEYQIMCQPGKGPFITPPPVFVTVGNEDLQDVNINVTPYYWFTDFKTTFVDSVFTATFNLEKIVADVPASPGVTAVPNNLEKIAIYFNHTSIADVTAKAFERNFTGRVPGPVTVSVDLKGMSLSEKQAIYGRSGKMWASVGIKSSLATDPLYAPTVALK